MIDLTTLLERAGQCALLDPINGKQVKADLDSFARDLEKLQRAVMEWRNGEADSYINHECLQALRIDVRNAADSLFDEYQLRI
jgi:hypothetical protein